MVSGFVNVGSWTAIGLSVIKHLLDQVRIRLISQLINGISRVLQKLLKYFMVINSNYVVYLW